MLTYMPEAYPAVGDIMEVDMKKLLALMLCASLTFGGAVTVFAEETGEAAEAEAETAETEEAAEATDTGPEAGIAY